MRPSDWLEAASLCVEGMEQVKGASLKLARLTRLGRSIVQTAFRFWEASEQSTQDTKRLATVLSMWQDAARTAVAGLQRSWLPACENRLATLHPEGGLKELADSVTLLARLFPAEYAQRPSVVQVADNLEKHWRNAR